MSGDDWNNVLEGHPIFSTSKSLTGDDSLELSLKSLRGLPQDDSPGPSSPMRRQVMCMKDNDLILASGSEVRMSCLGDARVSGGSQKTYKVKVLLSVIEPQINWKFDSGSPYAWHRFRNLSNMPQPQSKAFGGGWCASGRGHSSP